MTEHTLAPARRIRTSSATLALALGASALATAGAASAVVAPAAQAVESTYTVQAGDGWWIISQRTGVSTSQLMLLNGMTSADMLHPGMVLKTSGTTTSTAPVIRQSSGKQAAIDFALAKVADPDTYYAWGGNGPYGYDCSGLTKAAFAQAGITIPRTSHDQYMGARSYHSLSDAQPGDLVFWSNQSTGRMYHVAVYLGNGKVAHAMNPTDDLVVTTIDVMTSNRMAVVGRY